jgi:23S rRNA (uracil1939-C5)-methyltransferase
MSDAEGSGGSSSDRAGDAPAGATKGGILSASVRRTLREGEIPSTLVTCVHAETCAGCPLIELDYVQQLAAKRARVVTAVSHYPSLELVYTNPVELADPITGYRGRAKLIVAPSGAIGLYGRAGNHEVVDIPECRVLAPALADVAAALRRLIATPPSAARTLLLPFDPAAGGVLRALDLREVRAPGTGEPSVLVTLVLERDRATTRDELRAAGKALRPLLPRVVGLAANLHEADAPQILGPETLLLDGVGQAEDAIGGSFHVASFGSFVQAHRGQAARVHGLVAKEIASLEIDADRKPRVLDLYGGSGAISIALARARMRVTMVESFAPAAQSARVAAAAQKLDALDVRTGDAAEIAASLAAAGERFDAVVVNPPRRGVSPSAREAVARMAAPLVVYVSCDPDTLARDLDHLSRLGYAPSELAPLDMIPLTEEVETVSVVRRALPPAPRVFYEDDEVVVVEKAAHEPVAPHPEYMGSLLGRASRLPGGAKLRAVHPLDPGTSGLCILARTPEAEELWSAALVANGRLIYIAAAKGVTPAKGAVTRDLREGGRSYPARTRYRRLAMASGHSILRVIPDGSRTHQIRRHLAAIGHPILGDERYGHVATNRYFEEKNGLDRSFLHLVRIEITHPRTGARLLVESTLPGDLRAVLERASGGNVLRFLEQKHALGDQRTSSIPPPPDPRSANDGAPPSELERVPDLDESPRTRRHEIVSDDD